MGGRVMAAAVMAAAVVAGPAGTATEVPGLAALNAGGRASVLSLSCGSPATCLAGGYYTDGSGREQGFVVSERAGRWSDAIEVPGLGALNTGGYAQVLSVSCGAAGDCAATGNYTSRNPGRRLGFVALERNGRWSSAIEVPGVPALNAGKNAFADSVSCASATACTVGGSYSTDHSGDEQGYVAAEQNGHWTSAISIPGLRALTRGRYGTASVLSVSCRPAGNCAAAGTYTDGPSHYQGFVVSEHHGRWDSAIEVPGLGTLNIGGIAQVTSVSCAPGGSCAAAGYFLNSFFHAQAFLASEQNGRWGSAIQIPGLPGDSISPVACVSAGNCAAGGSYADGSGDQRAYLVTERNGRWATAIQVPGLPAAAVNATVESVSCGSAGNCLAAGNYTDDSGAGHGFTVTERNGRWGAATLVPGLDTLNHGSDDVPSITLACPPAGPCAGAGTYTDGSGRLQGFVIS